MHAYKAQTIIRNIAYFAVDIVFYKVPNNVVSVLCAAR